MIQRMSILKKKPCQPQNFFNYTSIGKLGVGKKKNSDVKWMSLRNEQQHNKYSIKKLTLFDSFFFTW